MTQNENRFEIEVKKVQILAKTDACRNILTYAKRMKESCERKAKEAELSLKRGRLSEESETKLQKKITQLLAETAAYMEFCIKLTNELMECQDKFINELNEYNEEQLSIKGEG